MAVTAFYFVSRILAHTIYLTGPDDHQKAAGSIERNEKSTKAIL